jgi:eukaryotic-like serine/threonine-protein kinase
MSDGAPDNPATPMRELRRLFDLVCDLPAGERHAALLGAATDAALIGEVEALLQADAASHTQARAPIARLLGEFAETELRGGDLLGAWRLLHEIGHGGMGSVFLAERADGHFQQQAAVKLIRGIADADAIARFARERQLLAHLKHAQIAGLLDGGATPSGQPYLVMEYVDGLPIDRWCRGEAKSPNEDDVGAQCIAPTSEVAKRAPGAMNRAHTPHLVDLDKRLGIFVSICKTLQFAHSRLIVHCDLKPSNILVRTDNVPVLLDFGVARALDRSDLPEQADAHNFLTPRYASPEQSRGEVLTVASDIYSLGVLLHELVSDQQPPKRNVGEATQPTLRPSRAAASDLPWRKRLSGDLDAIVARACAFDPAARYASALALADDIERIGQHRPVLARRRTRAYVGARLLRRQWPAFVGGLLVLVIASAFTWRTLAAEREARIHAATAERTVDFLVSVFAASDSNVNQKLTQELSAREVLDAGAARIDKELADQPRVQARLFEALGNAYRHMNLNETAAALLRKAAQLDLRPDVDQPLAAASSLAALANTLANGSFPAADAERAARESLALAERYTAPGSTQIANSWMVLSRALYSKGDLSGARAAGLTTLAMNEKFPEKTSRMPQALSNLGSFASANGDLAQARDYLQRALAFYRKIGEDDTAGFAITQSNYATALERSGDYPAAIAAQQASLDFSDKTYGVDSAFSASYSTGLARMLTGAGRYAQTLSLLDRTLAAQEKIHGKNGQEYTNTQIQIGKAYVSMGEDARALPILQQALLSRTVQYPDSDPPLLRSKQMVADALVNMGQANEEAHSLLDAATRGWLALGDGGVDLPFAQITLAQWFVLNARPAEASALLDRIEAPNAKGDAGVRTRAARLRADLAGSAGDRATQLAEAQRAYDLIKTAFGMEHPQTARFGLLLARDLRAAGKSMQAEPLERDLRPRFDAAFPADSRYRSEILAATKINP